MEDPGFELVAASLRADATDLAAFVEALAVKLEGALPGSVRVERRGTDLLIHVSMAGGGWVVASEPAWRGWRAIDGDRELRIRPADHAFIAFYLPQGEHEVRLFYRPRAFVIGAWISVVTLIALLIATRR